MLQQGLDRATALDRVSVGLLIASPFLWTNKETRHHPFHIFYTYTPLLHRHLADNTLYTPHKSA